MDEKTPAQGHGEALPQTSPHTLSIYLRGLIEAMDDLSDQIGPRGLPLHAVIFAALPVAKRLEQQLEDLDNG